MTRLQRVLPWVAAAAAWLYVALAAFPQIVGGYTDDAIYVSTAQSLADGRWFVVDVLPTSPELAKYPPLYPLWLAGWALLGDFTNDAYLHLVLAAQGVFWAAAVWVLFRHLAPRLDLAAGPLLAAALWMVTVTPMTDLFAAPMSEGPYTFVLTLSLVTLLSRGERPIALGLLMAAGSLLRRAHLSALLGIIIVLAWQRRWRELLGTVVGGLGAMGVTTALRASLEPRPTDDVLHYFTGYDSHFAYYTDAGSDGLARLLAVVSANASNGVASLSTMVFPGSYGPGSGQSVPLLGIALLVAGMAGLAVHDCTRAALIPLAAIVATYIVWVWPFSLRFWAPIAPWLIVGVAAGMNRLGNIGRLVMMPVALFIAAGQLIKPMHTIPARYWQPVQADHPSEQHLVWVRQTLRPGDMVLGGYTALHHAWRSNAAGLPLDNLLPRDALFELALFGRPPPRWALDDLHRDVDALHTQAGGRLLLTWDGEPPVYWASLMRQWQAEGRLEHIDEAPLPAWWLKGTGS